jgi:hypothetical protein
MSVGSQVLNVLKTLFSIDRVVSIVRVKDVRFNHFSDFFNVHMPINPISHPLQCKLIFFCQVANTGLFKFVSFLRHKVFNQSPFLVYHVGFVLVAKCDSHIMVLPCQENSDLAPGVDEVFLAQLLNRKPVCVLVVLLRFYK